jgi:hypothetical protein
LIVLYKSMESKEIKSFFIFNSDFHKTFEFIIDFKKTDDLFNDIRSKTEITKGYNTYSPGNTFFYKVNGLPIYFEVLSYHSEDNIKSIKWKVSSDFFDYNYEYCLYRCTVGEEVVLEWKLQFIGDKEVDKESIIKDQENCINRIKDYLKTQTTEFIICNSVIVRCERLQILKLLLDLNSFNNSFKHFGLVKYSGEAVKVGTKVTFSFPFFAIDLKFVVEKSEFSDKSKKWTYSLKAHNSQNTGSTPMPLSSVKEITFTIYKIHNKKILLEVKHQVLTNIAGEKIRNIDEQQNALLNDIIALFNDDKEDKEKESENEV